ncbi:unnamed protein product [Mytilus coruscus]|uniref:B box-type domain-containing protein n=1 Tax=Mytilus coruscus TaxID=42192 RepID=A0A6J8EN31_MYTCO|nr:unnamed protein product [Mytilus coruscus]
MASSKSIQKGQIPINCQLCETDKVIKWKCIECNLLMCNNCCDKIHLKFRNAIDHKIIDIKDVGCHDEELNFTNIKCSEHSRQFSCLFCKKCDSLVCPTCVSKFHKKHANDLIEISEAYEMKIDILKKRQNQLENGKASMITKKGQLSRLKAIENSKHMKVKQDILSYQKSLKTLIDNYFQQLEKELDRTNKSVLQHIECDLAVIIESIQGVENNKGEIKDFINNTDASKFFHNIRKMEKSIALPTVQTTNTYNTIPKFIPGEIMQSNVGVLQSDVRQSMELSVNTVINKTFQTDLSVVTYLCPCINEDISTWIACDIDNEVKRVKPDGNKLKVLSSLNTEVYGMAILQSDDVLLSTGGSKLQQLNITTGKLTDTVYNVKPLLATAIYITSGNKVVVGGYSEKLGRRAVFVMNEKGEHKTIVTGSDSGRVVVLGQGGEIINTYTGHTEINKDKQFRPVSIVTTPKDNVIVPDKDTHSLHILDNDGNLMAYHNKNNVILYPCTLAFTPKGQLYIGCGRTKGSTTNEAKIHEVTITGC